ncbi:MAG: hypothetical protein COA36_11940 [Desulfotalea sp.]|nr:MAG: hypothetical protein COA36_11940 [Desulfotalea sp.]
MDQELLLALWPQVVLPIARITCFIALGLFVASFIESLNWTHKLAAVARPLIKIGNLSTLTGASFSLAFFSGVSANTLLAEGYDKGQLSKKELILANLFNSLPRFFLHLPTVFFLTAPFIKFGAIVYVALTFSGAILQTVIIVTLGALLLPPNNEALAPAAVAKTKNNVKEAVLKSIKRLKKRIVRILLFLIPVYLIFFFLNWYGFFDTLEQYIATSGFFLNWLNPKAVGIVLLHVTTEFSAGLAAASALLADNSLTYNEVVIALLVGNILSTPIRAIRHQLPYYTGIYSPRLAIQLVALSQLTRAFCLILVSLIYFSFK